MASYSKTEVAAANLPVADMRKRLNPTAYPKHQSRFFAHVVRMGALAKNVALTEVEIDSLGGNLAYNFNRFADGKDANLRTGLNVSIQDLLTAWGALSNGTLNLDNGNGKAASAAPAATTTSTAVEVVPPVSPNVFASALKVFDGLRTSDPAFPVPGSADAAYGLLWDNLAEPVKAARASGVISDTLANLLTTNRVLFNGIITVLPDEIKDALEEVLMDRAFDTYRTSLKTTVEDVYHISKGARHAARYFSAWDTQVAEIANWNGRDEPLGWKPNEDQMKEANRNHAVTAFRNLATGLRNEVAASQPEPVQTEVLQPIGFNTILGRLLTRGPEIMAEVGGRWGAMSAQDQHAFVASMDAEDAAKAHADADADADADAEAAKAAAAAETNVTKVETKTPAKPAKPANPATGGSQPKA